MATEKADIKRGNRRTLSSVWAIPLLALLLGAYMVVQSWMTEGPEVEIEFSTADGLEPGKTKIKFRNVEMGLVESVRLNDNLDGVVATAKLDLQADPLLREDTRFWVVTARVGVDRITGLDTLLSGAYIQLSPGTGRDGWRYFKALEQPPLTPTDAEGLRLRLTSNQATSISTGDAVLYRGFKVGRVESVTFDPLSRVVRYVIFIDAPYHELVDTSVRFWDTSGISISAGADGVKIQTGSLDTVFLGGIAFGTPPGVRTGDQVEHNTEFRLYESYEELLKNPYKFGTYYVVTFAESVKGLEPGAPVEYRGIPIGRVERLLMRETIERTLSEGIRGEGDPIPVLIYLEPARMTLPDRQSSIDIFRESITLGVGNGMRASLESASLITGAKYINIDYYPNAKPVAESTFLDYTVIPTVGTGLDQLQFKVADLLDKFSALPLEETVENANEMLRSMDETLQGLSGIVATQGAQDLPGELEATLRELRTILGAMTPGSDLHNSLDSTLLQLNRALGDIRTLTNTLSAKPNAIILPSDLPDDPKPEAPK